MKDQLAYPEGEGRQVTHSSRAGVRHEIDDGFFRERINVSIGETAHVVGVEVTVTKRCLSSSRDQRLKKEIDSRSNKRHILCSFPFRERTEVHQLSVDGIEDPLVQESEFGTPELVNIVSWYSQLSIESNELNDLRSKLLRQSQYVEADPGDKAHFLGSLVLPHQPVSRLQTESDDTLEVIASRQDCHLPELDIAPIAKVELATFREVVARD